MEHLQHFGLSQDPFSNEPDLRFFFESGSHRDAQRRVERGLRQHKGLTLLTGDGGMGKTLLARRILESLEEELFEATLLVMLPGAADATSILQRLARQLGADEPATDRAALLGQIYEQLAIVREDGRHAVLIVDDAQIMTASVFAELGGLLSLEYEDKRLISMLLVGSPELDLLVQNDASIMPRVDVRVRLQPLDLPNATAYLRHRLAAVRGNPDLVSAAAMDALFKLGRGRPRLLNTLADNALFEAYLAGRSAIEPADVERAAADLGVGADPGTTFNDLSMAAPGPTLAPTVPFATPEATPTVATEAAFEIAPEVAIEMESEIVAAPVPALALDGMDLGAEMELAVEPPTEESTGLSARLSIEDPEGLARMPAESLDLDLDLDEGLEAALEEFGDAAAAAMPRVEPVRALDVDALEFDVEPVEGAEKLAEVDLLTSPIAAATLLDLEESGSPAAPTSTPPSPPPATPILDVLDADFAFAEAELAPLEAGDDDELSDIFVELIEE